MQYVQYPLFRYLIFGFLGNFIIIKLVDIDDYYNSTNVKAVFAKNLCCLLVSLVYGFQPNLFTYILGPIYDIQLNFRWISPVVLYLRNKEFWYIYF